MTEKRKKDPDLAPQPTGPRMLAKKRKNWTDDNRGGFTGSGDFIRNEFLTRG